MTFDALLSRFKIQTKVIALVLPFVASITAVGLVGLYASNLLQGRLAISNVVVASLSGFRETSAAMVQFMSETNKQNFDGVKSMLSEQDQALQRIDAGLDPNSASLADINTAVASSQTVEGGMDTLWALHQKETDLRDAIATSLDQLLVARKKIEDHQSTVANNIAIDETAAKASLFAAGNLADIQSAMEEFYSGYKGLSRSTSKMIVLQSSLPDISKRLQTLNLILPENEKSIADTAKGALDQIKSLVETGDKSDATMAAIDGEMEKIRGATDQIRELSEPSLLRSVQLLASLDGPAIQADKTQQDAANVTVDIYAIQIALAKFLVIPSAENRQLLISHLDAATAHLKVLSETAKGDSFPDELSTVLTPAVSLMADKTSELVEIEKRRLAAFAATSQEVDGIWKILTKFASEQKANADGERQLANAISIGATVAGIAIAVIAGMALIVIFKGPISRITLAMRKLADGALDTSIEGMSRADEIGDMARALGVFKSNAAEKLRMEVASTEQRFAAEAERARNEADKRTREEQLSYAVGELAIALERLSRGDLAFSIDVPFSISFEQLRENFNNSLARLRDALIEIRDDASALRAHGVSMRSAASDLSSRTESQAASLEETAAAVDEITRTVQSTAERAQQANEIATEAQEGAAASGRIVQDAIHAMSRIETASNKIQHIIVVIQEIAIQTNLLALNAGVEAARAGEAGNGFAVVATEVRLLAQRSTSAANEIKALINTASSEVGSGVGLVEETGKSLAGIREKVAELFGHVQVIATAAQNQSEALHEVNRAVNRMDQMTQANAAMVEETDTMSQQLASEAEKLMQLVGQFNISKDTASARGDIEAA